MGCEVDQKEPSGHFMPEDVDRVGGINRVRWQLFECRTNDFLCCFDLLYEFCSWNIAKPEFLVAFAHVTRITQYCTDEVFQVSAKMKTQIATSVVDLT